MRISDWSSDVCSSDLGRDERLCVFRLDSNHSTLDRVKTGLVLPLDRGAASHVIRAIDAGAAGATFARIRADGYAISYRETSPDFAAFAAPLFGETNVMIGALSISGLRLRFSEAPIPPPHVHLLPVPPPLFPALVVRLP